MGLHVGKKPEPQPRPVCETAHGPEPMVLWQDGYHICPRCGARVKVEVR